MEEVNNPFDGEAERYVRENGASQQVARDFVILKYLHEAGDTRPLAHWLSDGHFCPGFEVRRYLSWMLQPERCKDGDPNDLARVRTDLVPYALVSKSRARKPGKRIDLTVDEKNRAIFAMYHNLNTGPGTSDAAIEEVANILGPDISPSMVKEAIKERSRKG